MLFRESNISFYFLASITLVDNSIRLMGHRLLINASLNAIPCSSNTKSHSPPATPKSTLSG